MGAILLCHIDADQSLHSGLSVSLLVPGQQDGGSVALYDMVSGLYAVSDI